MKLNAACAVLALLTGVITTDAQRDYRDQTLDLLRLLATKPWNHGTRSRWDRTPHIHVDLDPQQLAEDEMEIEMEKGTFMDDVDDGLSSVRSSKRSAVATALNTGRRRRQPTPALGKEVTPYVGVGVLNDVGSFFDSLRGNLESLASLSPEQRSTLFQEPPNVVLAASSGGGGGGGGGGTGMGRLHALRPLRPTGNSIRSYNRRSFLKTEGEYPRANHHDPGLLWTGLGR